MASHTLRTSYDLSARGYHSYRQEKPALQPARNVMRVITRHAAHSCQNAYKRCCTPGLMGQMSRISTYCELEARNMCLGNLASEEIMVRFLGDESIWRTFLIVIAADGTLIER